MTLPPPLDRLQLGEVLGHLRTAGQVPLTDPDGGEQLVSLWFVLCRDRGWLVGATREAAWTVASAELALERGWTRDAIRVGRWSAPLRAGTRGQASGLLARWRLAERGGQPVEPVPPELPPERAPMARGAELPAWIPERVPADPQARWLVAVDTGERASFPGLDGRPVRAPLWFAATDQRAVLVADGPWLRVEPAGERWPAELLEARDRWGPAAWEGAVQRALDAREGARAAELLAEAWLLERHGACWRWMGLVALAGGEPEVAVGAVLRELAGAEPGALAAGAAAWTSRLRRLERDPPRLAEGPRTDCALPDLPAGLPWPPEGPAEVYALAGLLAGPPWEAPAFDLLAEVASPARVAAARAAVVSARGEADAGAAWWRAAELLHDSDPSGARVAAERAIAALPDGPARAEARWRASAWAVQAHASPLALWEAALPAPPPADLPLPPETWRRLAGHAAASGADAAAAVAWRAVHTALPRELLALREEAAVLERLGRPEHAIGALRTLAERLERHADPSPPRWWVQAEIARLATPADPGQADAALRQAVAGDFLQVQALDAALAQGAGVVEPARLAWWSHLRAVLAGGPVPPGRQPVDALSPAALDALHPGGEGWLARVRRSLDVREPPAARDLVRGLERVEAGRWPELVAALDALSAALGIPAPAAYLFRGEGAWGLSAWPTEPPVLLVGHAHLEPDGPLAMPSPALRFALAVELAHLAAEHPLLSYDAGLVGTGRSVYAAFGRYAGTAETVMDLVTLVPGVDQLAKLQTVVRLSRRVFVARQAVDKASELAESGRSWLGWSREQTEAVGRSFQGAAVQFRLLADRAALTVTGDLQAAVEAIVRGTPEGAALAERAAQDGLVAVLDQLDPEARIRIAGLLAFAATL